MTAISLLEERCTDDLALGGGCLDSEQVADGRDDIDRIDGNADRLLPLESVSLEDQGHARRVVGAVVVPECPLGVQLAVLRQQRRAVPVVAAVVVVLPFVVKWCGRGWW